MSGPTNDEGPTLATPTLQDEPQTHAPIIGDAVDSGKELRRLKLIAAISDVSVYDLADGSHLVKRGGLSRAVPDVCALARFLRESGIEFESLMFLDLASALAAGKMTGGEFARLMRSVRKTSDLLGERVP